MLLLAGYAVSTSFNHRVWLHPSWSVLYLSSIKIDRVGEAYYLDQMGKVSIKLNNVTKQNEKRQDRSLGQGGGINMDANKQP